MRIAVIGAGGQGREVAWTIEAIGKMDGKTSFVGFIVTDLDRESPHDSADLILGDYRWLDGSRGQFDGLAMGVGNPQSRRLIAAELSEQFPDVPWPTLIHPSAVVDLERCRIGRGAYVGAGAVLTVNVEIADFALANFATSFGHEARLGSCSVVNPGCSISGGVTIGEQVLVGAGARILQYLSVGSNAIVGAGAVVTRNVPPGQTWAGIPARPMVQGAED